MGKSITNDDEQTFADTMRILKLTRNKIVLQEQDYKWEMVRMPE
jgi:hypothetical protein